MSRTTVLEAANLQLGRYVEQKIVTESINLPNNDTLLL
jgi:DNA replicative helicase MCM subunit Mcm2 (Cdc46/Mcm family)